MNRDFHLSLFFVNCERTVLFSVKRDLDPPLPPSLFSTLMFAGFPNQSPRLTVYTYVKVDSFWVVDINMEEYFYCILNTK